MWSLHLIDFTDLANWAQDDHLAALTAFARQSLKPENVQYRQGDMGVEPACLADLVEKAGRIEATQSPRRFFEANFVPHRLIHSDAQTGQVTAFYEPEIEARRPPMGAFQTPLFRRPSDLVALRSDNRPKELDESYRFGRKGADGSITAYFDRSEINAGAINKTTDAIAYVEDPIEAFFIHIQGAARLTLEDGSAIRITYDGKTGHPFTPIGKLLVERGELDAQEVSMQSIKAWLRANPDRSMQLMEENRSYIFFKQSDGDASILGPIAAAKVPLTAGRSLAVDRLIHTFGTPIFVNADNVNGRPFNRLMIAQETGTAIVGPARGDIFCGTGDEAGAMAGDVNCNCTFTLLIPKASEIHTDRMSCP